MLVNQFDAFLIDLDGVVYLDGSALPGAVETLRRLREQGKTVRFLGSSPRSWEAVVRVVATRRVE